MIQKQVPETSVTLALFSLLVYVVEGALKILDIMKFEASEESKWIVVWFGGWEQLGTALQCLSSTPGLRAVLFQQPTPFLYVSGPCL